VTTDTVEAPKDSAEADAPDETVPSAATDGPRPPADAGTEATPAPVAEVPLAEPADAAEENVGAQGADTSAPAEPVAAAAPAFAQLVWTGLPKKTDLPPPEAAPEAPPASNTVTPPIEAAPPAPDSMATDVSAVLEEFRFATEVSLPAPTEPEPSVVGPPVEAPPPDAPPPMLAIRGVTRRFGAVTALGHVELELRHGEILVLLGENGAGKTTLLNILAGRDRADSGDVMVSPSGAALASLKPGSPQAAIAAGMRLVDAGDSLAADLTGLENIMLGTQSLWRWRLSRRKARNKIAELTRHLDMNIALDTRVAQLGAGDRLRVKILRALYAGARVLMLDEPTTALTPQEWEALVDVLKRLTAEGLAVIMTTRKADEAFIPGAHVVALRAGRKVADIAAIEGRGAIEAQMWGDVQRKSTPSFHAAGDLILELRNVDVVADDPRASLHRVSLEIRAGEIVGIACLGGNGHDTLAELIAGLIRPTSGDMRLFGRRLARFDAAAFVRAGIGWIPRDRLRHGIIPDMSIAENLVLEDIGRTWFNRYGILRFSTISQHAREIIADHVLDCPRPELPAGSLNAPAIEKLVLARALDRKLRLFVANQPALGLDGARAEDVHRRIEAEREAGAAVVLISEDIDELLVNADVIGVLHEGRLSVPQPTGAFDRRSLGLMMGGHGSLAQDWHGWGDGG
jgi:simple sugar transport system ATP-binding protein